jgi:hypothetical protein
LDDGRGKEIAPVHKTQQQKKEEDKGEDYSGRF